MAPRLPRALFWWTLTLLWAGNIFLLSTESFGGNNTRALLARILDQFGLQVAPDTFAILHLLSRKLAHCAEYGVLAYLLFHALEASNDPNARRQGHANFFRLASLTLAISATYALTDELHQSFVHGRGASFVDCSFDVTGACAAMALLFLAGRPKSQFR